MHGEESFGVALSAPQGYVEEEVESLGVAPAAAQEVGEEDESPGVAPAAAQESVVEAVHGLSMSAEPIVQEVGIVGSGVAPAAAQGLDVPSIVKQVVSMVLHALQDLVRAPIMSMMESSMHTLASSIIPDLIAKHVKIASSGSTSGACALEQRVAHLESQVVALQSLLRGLGLEEEVCEKEGCDEESVGAPSSMASMTREDQLHLIQAMAQGESDDEATHLAQAFLEVQQQRLEKTNARKMKQKQRKQKASATSAASSLVQYRADAQ